MPVENPEGLQANEPKTLTTYRLANGEPVFGEYEWVTGPEFFEKCDEPTTVIKEEWVLESAQEIVYGEASYAG